MASADIITNPGGSSEVILSGTTTQTIGGTTGSTIVFPSLTINNVNGVTLSKGVQVNGTLTLTSGNVNIGNNNFAFGSLATVAGTPSATNMIVATGTGQVQRFFSAPGTFVFPVGDNTATAEYSPVSLNFTAGTFSAGAFAGVNLVNASYNDPAISGSFLNRYWNVSQTGITGFACNALFNYVPADVTGTESSISGIRIAPLPLTVFGPANIGLHQLSAPGLTSFGTFTGGPGTKTLSLKLFLEGFYTGAGAMYQAQGVVGNQFAGTTVDQISVELHDPTTYATQVWSITNQNLNTSGLATISVPGSFGSSYYVTVRHRNSIDLISALPITFASQTINYDFTTALTQAFGSNMQTMSGGAFAMYGGDANGDGAVDALDLLAIQNDAISFAFGYLLTDLNGDGSVDVLDLILAQNNAILFVSIINP